MTRSRHYSKIIGYHVWGVFKRHNDNMDANVRPESDKDTLIESKGARGIGDDAARAYVRDRTDALNEADARASAILGAC